MGTKLRASPKFSMIDGNGDPAVGWKIYTYVAGTTTNKATYTDNAQTSSNTNPVILDARGEADIWWSGTYKVVVKDANDVTIYSVDNYGAGEDISVSGFYNLATNGSFEIDDNADNLPDSWTITEYDATSTVILDTADPNHGASCLKFISTGLGGGYASSVLMEVSGSQDLLVGFDLKSSVVDVRNRVEISWYDKNQALLSTTSVYDDSATNPTSWTSYQYPVTAHASAKYAKITIYGCHSSDATSGETRFDNIQVVAVTGTMMLQDSDSVAITGGTISGLTQLSTTNLFTLAPTTAGSATAYTANVGETAYTTNRVYAVTIHTDNTGSATMNLDSIGAKTIKDIFGTALIAGQLQAGQQAQLIYDGTDLLLLNPMLLSANTVGSDQLVAGSWVEIDSSSSSNPTLTGMTDTYNIYKLEFWSVAPSTTGLLFAMRWGNGSIDTSTAYDSSYALNQNDVQISGTTMDAVDDLAGTVIIYNARATDAPVIVDYEIFFVDGGAGLLPTIINGTGSYNINGVIDRIGIYDRAAIGNFTGEWRLSGRVA